MTDVHSPDQFRSVTVRNLDGWYAAFEIETGDKLYLAPTDRVLEPKRFLFIGASVSSRRVDEQPSRRQYSAMNGPI
jgi:hypothetical protein